MLEKFYEHDVDKRMLFLDFKQAFDSIRRGELYKVTQRKGTAATITKLDYGQG
jgi:hypothetical protein